MIDTHIHLLHRVDDGARDLQVALEMIQVALDDGINQIICTPHDLNYVYQNPRKKVLRSVEQLQNDIDNKNLSLKLYPGAELHVDPDLVSKVLEGEAMTLADRNKHVLLEFPKHLVPHGSENIIENLLFNNFTPIIAHPERNPTLAKRTGMLKEWVSWGCKTQLTAMSVTGEFSSDIQSTCKQWCHQGLVHLVASDAHRPTGRAPILSKAHATLSQWLGTDSADVLLKTNPQHIIDGIELEDIPITQGPKLKKSRRPLFSFFGRKKQSSRSARL